MSRGDGGPWGLLVVGLAACGGIPLLFGIGATAAVLAAFGFGSFLLAVAGAIVVVPAVSRRWRRSRSPDSDDCEVC